MAQNPAAFSADTRRTHRRQVLWQILVPLIASVVLAAFLFYLVLAAGPGSIERSAQLAAILLALPTLAIGLGALAVLIILTSSVSRLMKWLPKAALRAQRAAQSLNTATQTLADWVAKPFVLLESWGTALRKVFRRRGMR
ncbi:MAG: hypothetical protein WEA61_01600 [Anaerolineales bacterium]